LLREPALQGSRWASLAKSVRKRTANRSVFGERRRRKDHAKRIKIEKERRAQLEAATNAWQRAAAIRRLCGELERRKQVDDRFAPDVAKQSLEWARAIAAKHDPFDNGHLAQAVQDVGLDTDLDCSREIPLW
jgi:hypothetical protein